MALHGLEFRLHRRSFFLVRLNDAQFQELLAEILLHVRKAFAFHVHHRHAAEDGKRLRVLRDLHHAGDGADNSSAAAGRAWPNVHRHVKLGLGYVVLRLDRAGFLVDHRPGKLNGARLAGGLNGFHLAVRLDVDFTRHRQPDFAAAFHGFSEV